MNWKIPKRWKRKIPFRIILQKHNLKIPFEPWHYESRRAVSEEHYWEVIRPIWHDIPDINFDIFKIL